MGNPDLGNADVLGVNNDAIVPPHAHLEPETAKQPGTCPTATPSMRAKARFLHVVGLAAGRPLPLSAACPLIHWRTGRPLLRQFYDFDVAGVPRITWAQPRHSSPDHLTLSLPSTTLNADGLRRLEDWGFVFRDDWRQGTLSARFGPLRTWIRASLRGNLRDPVRKPMVHLVGLNPSWFTDLGSVCTYLNLLFMGFHPDRAEIKRLDCACDWGIPSDLYKMLQATDSKFKGVTYQNVLRRTRGMVNGMSAGAGDDIEKDYDKQREVSYRKPELAEDLADVPWWRHERQLRGPKVPIKTLADFSDLADFEPFGAREYRLIRVNDDKVQPSRAHWRSLLKKLYTFEVVMGRESTAQAIKALNGQGHFRRLVRSGYIEMTPVALDLNRDWREGIEAMCSPGGALKGVVPEQAVEETEHGYY